MIRPFVKEITQSLREYPLSWEQRNDYSTSSYIRNDGLRIDPVNAHAIFLRKISKPNPVELGFWESWIINWAVYQWCKKATLDQVMKGKIK